jgi:hypothetical protein
MYLISWEEGVGGPDELLLAKEDKIIDIELLDASPRDSRENNETLLYKKWETHKK